jgi:hypothetical protein
MRRSSFSTNLVLLIAGLSTGLSGGLGTTAFADELPTGYWPPERTPEILQLTDTVRLSPSLADLTPGENRAVQELLEAGKIVQRIYEDQRHPQALQAWDALQALAGKMGNSGEVQSLVDLYRLFNGPIATTPDNHREAFLPVAMESASRNVYPNIARAQLDAYLAEHPDERDELLSPHTVVQTVSADNLKRDLGLLTRYQAIDVLHPGLRRRLETMLADFNGSKSGDSLFYAVPYSLRWAPEISRIYIRLNNAARAIENSDEDLARYLRNRARDLLSDDYESGDSSWIKGNFKHLNVLIGAYETYDDTLYGAKAFMSLSVLKKDDVASVEARASLNDLQSIENALPVPKHRRIDDNIGVGAYEVIADFGQARGRNNASTLPNDPFIVKRYGRMLILRKNILQNPQLFALQQTQWKALMTSPFDSDFTEEGEFNRVLWREIGHYLGVNRDKRGKPLSVALEVDASVLEELKADLVSLFAANYLRKHRDLSEHDEVMWLASGLNRTLSDSKPRPEQVYRTMQVMQFNWFVEHGVVQIEPANNSLIIHYDRFAEAVNSMLEAVLKLQYEGDRAAAAAFIERWSSWRGDLHDVIAKTMRDNGGGHYVLVKYGVLGE